ncbi:MAG: hypothetical protein RL026_2510 [Pseudomonadota bacterium]
MRRRCSGPFLAFAALALTACTPKGAPPADASAEAPAGKPVLTVAVESVAARPLEAWLSVSGAVHPWQEVVVGAEISGQRLAELRADVGDRVRRGQVLARLDARVLQTELQEAQAQQAEALALREEAEANAVRAAGLKSAGALSARDTDQLLAAAKAAAARLQSAEARLAAARLRRSFADIVAPDDGVVAARSGGVGQVVVAGGELFRLIRQGRLEWRAEVQEADMALARVGQVARLRQGDQWLAGTVRTLAPGLEPGTRTGLAYIDLPPDTPLRAGMFVEGGLAAGRREGLTVPASALLQRDGFDYVFVLGDADRVLQRRVQRGLVEGDRIEVKAGLAAGERVVVDGVGFLRDGDLVRVATGSGA